MAAAGSLAFGLNLIDSSFSNIYLGTLNVTVYSSNYSQFSNIKCHGTVTFHATYPTLHSNWTNCDFDGSLTLNTGSNYNSFSNCKVGVDAGGGATTIVVASGATGTTITGCRTDAAISNSGTDTAGTGNRVY
jgi:hypothetical protein